jgi:hypothetical protein
MQPEGIMSKSVDEQWQDLCDEFDKAQDAVAEAMSDRNTGTYQSADFWERLEKAQDRWNAVKKKLDDFRKAHSKS